MVVRMLKCVQSNCQNGYAVTIDLGQMLVERGVNVALLQEPYCFGGCVRGLPSGVRVFQSRGARADAAVVICDSTIEAVCMDDCTNEFGVCVWIKCEFGEFYLLSVYCRFSDSLAPYLDYLDLVRSRLGDRKLLIGMDANAASELWFSKNWRAHGDQARGENLAEWILWSGLSVVNEPSPYFTFSGANGQSDINVTLTGAALLKYELSWCVMPDWGVSDHNVILIRVGGEIEERTVTGWKRWSTRGTDWRKYRHDLREIADAESGGFLEETCPEALLECMMGWIDRANEKHMRSRVDRGVRSNWWNSSINKSRRVVRKARRKYQRARNIDSNSEQCRELGVVYRRELAKYKRDLRSAKESAWQKFVSTVGNENPWGAVYKVCMGKKVEGLQSLNVDGYMTRNWDESASVLLDRFFPPSGLGVPDPETGGDEGFVLDPGLVRAAVWTMGLRRSPGLDGVNAVILRSVYEAIPEYLVRLYEMCFRTGTFPGAWKEARLAILLKGPERDRSDPSSYRPICLLSVMGKVLERLMVDSLNELVSDSLCDSQYGFRKGLSAEDAWYDLKQSVKASDKKYVVGVFVDFKGAFDNLEWRKVLERLADLGLADIALWRSYFSDRGVYAAGIGGCIWKRVERGCPQGSICGPTVWNLLMNDLLLDLRSNGCKVIAYADDLVLLVEGDTRLELERLGERFVGLASAWGARVGVDVSTSKTVQMVLKGHLSSSRPPFITLNGVSVRSVREIKYLGIWMTERFNFRVHLNKARVKSTIMAGRFSRVLRKEWGLGRKAMTTLYKGLLTSVVMYGASAFEEVTGFKYGIELLNRCQRVCMVACLKVCRTVSTDAMQVLMGSLPWDLECQRRATGFRLRRGRLNDSDVVSAAEVEGMSAKAVRKLLSDRLHDRWQERWNESTKGRVTFEFIKDVRFVSDSKFAFSMAAGFLLTGHGSLNDFLSRRGLVEDGSCGCGLGPEDWRHVLVHCPWYDHIRNLRAIGVRVNGDTVDVSRVVSDSVRYSRFELFAKLVFACRLRMMNNN